MEAARAWSREDRQQISSYEAEADDAVRFEAVRPHLVAIARSLLPDPDDAEDLVQTTLEIGLRRLSQLRDPSALRPWLISIELREAYRLRRRVRRLVGLDRAQEVESHDRSDDLEVRQALSRLPQRTRTCIVLHVMAGFSVAETAQAMGTAENTVKTQLRKGLAALRKELSDA